jgi:head-tail adaptor
LRTPDSSGGFPEDARTEEGTIPVRVRPLSASERILGSRESSQSTHRIYAKSDAAVEFQDVLRVGTNDYEVMGLRPPSELGHHLEIQARERVFET